MVKIIYPMLSLLAISILILSLNYQIKFKKKKQESFWTSLIFLFHLLSCLIASAAITALLLGFVRFSRRIRTMRFWSSAIRTSAIRSWSYASIRSWAIAVWLWSVIIYSDIIFVGVLVAVLVLDVNLISDWSFTFLRTIIFVDVIF